MINTDMRKYNYYLYSAEDAYGQPQLIKDESGELEVQGQVKMSINIASQTVQDNILYGGAQYVGLTRDSLDSKHVIQYGEEKLKVLYVSNKGRLSVVFMARM